MDIKNGWVAVSVLLVVAWLLTVRQFALSSTAGCEICAPDTCALQAGEYLLYVRTTMQVRCVDYDKDGKSHCANVSRKEYEVYTDPQPGVVEHVFQRWCYKIGCAQGTPTQTVCSPGWTPPSSTTQFSGGQTASKEKPDLSSTCKRDVL